MVLPPRAAPPTVADPVSGRRENYPTFSKSEASVAHDSPGGVRPTDCNRFSLFPSIFALLDASSGPETDAVAAASFPHRADSRGFPGMRPSAGRAGRACSARLSASRGFDLRENAGSAMTTGCLASRRTPGRCRFAASAPGTHCRRSGGGARASAPERTGSPLAIIPYESTPASPARRPPGMNRRTALLSSLFLGGLAPARLLAQEGGTRSAASRTTRPRRRPAPTTTPRPNPSPRI